MKSLNVDSIIEGIKIVVAAAIPLAVAFGVSAGDIASLGEATEAAVVASSGVIVAARKLLHAIQHRNG